MPSAAKRHAAGSPVGEGRPAKRLASSSPEEGELDDEVAEDKYSGGGSKDVAQERHAQVAAALARKRSKVEFPFQAKGKDGPNRDKPSINSQPSLMERMGIPKDKDQSNTTSQGSRAPAIYERSQEDERRIRETEERERARRRDRDPQNRWRSSDSWRPPRGHDGASRRHGDHYEPSYSRDRDRDEDRDREAGNSRSDVAEPYRSGLSDGRSDQNHTKGTNDAYPNASPSPLRSVSPHSLDSRQGNSSNKHRLPGSQSRPYHEEPRNRSISPVSYNGDRASPSSSRHYYRDSRAFDSYDLPAATSRPYDRERDYERDPRDQYRRDDYEDYRERSGYGYDDAYERDRYNGDRDDYDWKRSRPRSRSPTPPPPTSYRHDTTHTQRTWDEEDRLRMTPRSTRPVSPTANSHHTVPPPPPASPPPLPPQPQDGEPAEALAADHQKVSIAIPAHSLLHFKRLGAPVAPHSPSPMSLPSARPSAPADDREDTMDVDGKGDAIKRNAVMRGRKAREGGTSTGENGSLSKVVVKKRKPVRRTKEQEKELYSRVFTGCGAKGDYDVLTKLGEGTFGEVHKAIWKERKVPVAIKRILMHNEKEGMPVTALREIKILKALKHHCIVELLDMFVVPSQDSDHPMSVYMVFPYMDHDLAGLLENERVKLQPSQIKLYMKQLLEGTEYMHRNNILHRDMKAANLLISNSGSLRIADFGLARSFDPMIVTRAGRKRMAAMGGPGGMPVEKKYTNCVVTRWYRPPELLLGAKHYGGEVDLWGIGCVLGEMFWRRPILPGNSDLDQLDKIWSLCGSPNQQNWPDYDQLPGCEGVIRFPTRSRRVKDVYESIGKETCELLDALLTLDPRERITATMALDHDYFWTDPLPADPKTLPSYEASHEFDQRGRRQQVPPPLPGPLPLPPPQNAGPGANGRGLPPPLHIKHGVRERERERERDQMRGNQQFGGRGGGGYPSHPPHGMQGPGPGVNPYGAPPLPMHAPYLVPPPHLMHGPGPGGFGPPPGAGGMPYNSGPPNAWGSSTFSHHHHHQPQNHNHNNHNHNNHNHHNHSSWNRPRDRGPSLAQMMESGMSGSVPLPPRPSGLPVRPNEPHGKPSGGGGGGGRGPPNGVGDGGGGLNYG